MIQELFDKHDGEYRKFDRIENKRSKRSDLHAFLLIDELFPSTDDIVAWAGHDELFIEADFEQVETLTEDQVIELVRCGVMFEEDGLKMYV